jgi:two-component system sensor histidine kinase and response regulator WspE
VTRAEKLLKQFRELVAVRMERINRSIMELETGGSVESGAACCASSTG